LNVTDAPRALAFYQRAFGAEERFRLFGLDGTSVIHPELKRGHSILTLGWELPRWGKRSSLAPGGAPVTFNRYVADIEAVFKHAVEAGVLVRQPITDGFWGGPPRPGGRSLLI
jgi:PhnB protein